MRVAQLIGMVAVVVVVATSSAWAKDKVGVVIAGWPATMPGVKSAEAGEHPRLLFRRGDLVALREKAATPEGKALLARLRVTLDGADGETFPKLFNASGHAYQGNKAVSEDAAAVDNGAKNSDKSVGKLADDGMPLGTFTMSHAAGYGLLYQLTGEKKFAELGQQAMQKSLDGVRDRDDRYSFRKPGGALRCGPSLGWTALGYDLCYDGWSPEFRQKVREDLDFHTLQVLEAGYQQARAWEGQPEAEHLMVAVVRDLAAFCPTRRAGLRTAQTALRLERGEKIYAEAPDGE